MITFVVLWKVRPLLRYAQESYLSVMVSQAQFSYDKVKGGTMSEKTVQARAKFWHDMSAAWDRWHRSMNVAMSAFAKESAKAQAEYQAVLEKEEGKDDLPTNVKGRE